MKKVLFDTIFLSMLFHQKDRFPVDPTTKAEVTNPKERIEYLVETLEQDDAKIIVPTPALGELLAVTGASGPLYLSELHGNSVFDIAAYDERAAIENGALEASGAKRVNDAPRQKVKVDRQILAIAKTKGVEVIYSDDKDVKTMGEALGIKVVCVSELPLRPVEPMPPLLQLSEAHGANEPAPPSEPTLAAPSASAHEPVQARPEGRPAAPAQQQPDLSPDVQPRLPSKQ